jgi:hypothetical protein
MLNFYEKVKLFQLPAQRALIAQKTVAAHFRILYFGGAFKSRIRLME